jgi:hypothetical protein
MKILALAAAVICFVLAGLYATGNLQGGPEHVHHVKHAIVFGVLGIVALVWMRFQSGAAAPGVR